MTIPWWLINPALQAGIMGSWLNGSTDCSGSFAYED